MLEPRVVTIDGDQYILTLPGINGIKYLLNQRSLRMENYGDFYVSWCDYYVSGPPAFGGQYEEFHLHVVKGIPTLCGSNEYFASYEVEHGRIVKRYTGYKDFQANKWYGYIPMLVPLSRDGSDISAQFRKNNPNGTLLLGGTMTCNGAPIAPEEHVRCKYGEQLGMSDSVEGKKLAWICYCGHMYAVSPCCEIQFPILETFAPAYAGIGEDGRRY